MRSLMGALCAVGVAALALVLTERSVSAWGCDFLTGGGFIYFGNGAKGTFGVGAGCKDGSGTGTPAAPYWGHLEFQDEGSGLNVHGTSITAYQDWGFDGVDANGQPIGRRLICGAGTTNDPNHPNVYFFVVARDAGESGVNDTLEFGLTDPSATYPYYDTGPQTLGGGADGGGDIQVHKPNDSTTGVFGGSCPALAFEGL